MFLRKKHFNSHFFVNNCIPTITGKVTFFSLVEIFSTSEKKKRYLIELISSHKNWVKKKTLQSGNFEKNMLQIRWQNRIPEYGETCQFLILLNFKQKMTVCQCYWIFVCFKNSKVP